MESETYRLRGDTHFELVEGGRERIDLPLGCKCANAVRDKLLFKVKADQTFLGHSVSIERARFVILAIGARGAVITSLSGQDVDGTDISEWARRD